MRGDHDGGADPGRIRIGASDCERIRTGPVAQPVNTATSLAYVAAAAVTLARYPGGDPAQRRHVRLFSAVLALVGLGSAAFHGPQPPGAKALHDLPIAALLTLMLGAPALRAHRGDEPLPGWTRRRGWGLAAGTLAGLAAYRGGRTGARTCDPDSLIQLHGAWHVLSAATLVAAADILDGTAPDTSGVPRSRR